MNLGHRTRLTLLHVGFFVLIEALLAGLLLWLMPDDFTVDGDIRRALLLIALPASVAASALVAWAIAARMDRPIEQLAEFARELEPGAVSEPMDVDDAGGAIEQLQDDLNAALVRLDEGYAAQAQFVANVAHELKTPIAVMLTDTQVLLTRERPVAEYAEYAVGMEKEMRRLGRLVESFLIVTRAEREHGLTQHVCVHLPDVLLESVEHCSGYAKLFEVRLVPQIELADEDDAPELLGDPELLRTMLDNLVRNAVRYSPENGAVEVRLEALPGSACFRVRDDGPGIPPDELESIFERFEQAQSSHPRTQGSGLGLSIATSVARLHAGRISVRNLDEGGCEFTVTLPVEDGEPRH